MNETQASAKGSEVPAEGDMTELLTTNYMGMCPYCNGLVAITKADTLEEEADALADAAGWKRRGLDIYKRTYKTTDPMPHWCARKCG